MERIGDILRGDPSRPGQQYVTQDGAIYTRGPTNDPSYPPGSHFLSVYNSDGQKLPTAILGPDGQRIG